MYSVGALRTQCFGIECVGFNTELSDRLLESNSSKGKMIPIPGKQHPNSKHAMADGMVAPDNRKRRKVLVDGRRGGL